MIDDMSMSMCVMDSEFINCEIPIKIDTSSGFFSTHFIRRYSAHFFPAFFLLFLMKGYLPGKFLQICPSVS